MSKIIIANFKMNKNFDECANYVKVFKKFAVQDGKVAVLCPPAFALPLFAHELHKNKKCFVGAQNCAFATNGAFTGELSATMIKSTGAKYVILGHSERRNILGETDEVINKKVKLAIEAGLVPVVCIGEKLEEISRKKTILSNQIKKSLDGVDLAQVVIAYEPIWAIGTGMTCESSDIAFVHEYIKSKFKTNAGDDPIVVYGGSVKSANASEILNTCGVDGVLVGGASLDPNEFLKIVRA